MRHSVVFFIAAFSLLITAITSWAQKSDSPINLTGEDGEVTELALETFLAPGEFPGRLFVHISKGEEAVFSLDSSLGAIEPFAELHPERLPWPQIAGLDLVVEGSTLKLKPTSRDVDDATLDKGFEVRWTITPLGQRIEPAPYFAAKVVEAEVLSSADARVLFLWRAESEPPVCRRQVQQGKPNCDLQGISREVRALALSPDGALLALAIGGLRPRLEVWNVDGEPRLVWQSLFSANSGGAQEVAFSADGEWIVALTGQGRMHRFDSATGGSHLGVPSTGRAARAIPPGKIMAVAGDAGEVNLWYLADGTIAWRLPPRQVRGPVDRLAASGDGERLATLEYSEEASLVRVWRLKNRTLLAQFELDPYAVTDIALDSTGEILFAAHEKMGLLKAKIEKRAQMNAVGKQDSDRCRGRLQWIRGLEVLSCAVPGGEIQLDRDGRLRKELETGVKASDWIADSSAGGRRMAAVGGGHLLLWWAD